MNWQRTSGVGVNTPNHARCSWTAWSFWKGGGAAHHDPDVDAGVCAGADGTRVGSPANQQRFDEALVWFQRAEEALEGLVHDPQHLEVILSIDEVATNDRRRCSVVGGLEEPRRRLLESHIGMLERLSERAGADPAIGLLAALARLDLAPDDSASAKLRAAIERFPANGRLPERLEEKVADWIAGDIQPYPSDPKSTGEPQGRLDPDAHADAVIRALESRCEALGVYPALLPAAALQVAGIAAVSGRGATKGWPPGRCPLDRRMSLRLREDAGTKRSQRSGVPPGAVRSLRAGIEKRLESQGFPDDRRGACERRWAKPVPRYVSTPETRTRESRSRVSRTRWSVSPPSDRRRNEHGDLSVLG